MPIPEWIPNKKFINKCKIMSLCYIITYNGCVPLADIWRPGPIYASNNIDWKTDSALERDATCLASDESFNHFLLQTGRTMPTFFNKW